MRAKATQTRGRLAVLLIASALLAGAMPVASAIGGPATASASNGNGGGNGP